MLYQRWQLRRAGALVTRDRRQYDFETKLEIVRRHVNGESGRALAEEYDLPSPTTVANWTVIYRRDGEDGLRPKRRGRPPTDRGDSPDEKRARDTAHRERTTSRRSRVLGKIAGLEVAGTTGESSSCRRSQGAISAGTLAADRAPPQIDVLRPPAPAPSRGHPNRHQRGHSWR
ncbi:helix-turn-helix domain-containing protein, partial [Rhodococcus sp. IEGM 1366]|uniref:helix-turn-helix domain-containing protein n=1 Tax=Rhodococcus sp. IEGM 1366 TaxID=3082223 RepID=UPI003989ADBB